MKQGVALDQRRVSGSVWLCLKSACKSMTLPCVAQGFFLLFTLCRIHTRLDNMEQSKVGRPTKYQPEFCEDLIQHMEGGFSLESFAAKLRVSKNTVYSWVKQFPEFQDAFEQGQALRFAFFERVGIDGIFDRETKSVDEDTGIPVIEKKKVNAALYKLFMSNLFGWTTEKKESNENVTHKVGEGTSQQKEEAIKKLNQWNGRIQS